MFDSNFKAERLYVDDSEKKKILSQKTLGANSNDGKNVD